MTGARRAAERRVHVEDIPPGEFHARNITPDTETGIGQFSDGAIARALRHGVGHDGRALLPFMELQGLSDEDLVAVVSYLRSQPRGPQPGARTPVQPARQGREGDGAARTPWVPARRRPR